MNAEQLKQYEELAAGALLLGRDRHASAIMALIAEVERLQRELRQAQAQLAAIDDFGADCYEWGLDNKTWRPDFAEWLQWKREEAQQAQLAQPRYKALDDEGTNSELMGWITPTVR